jgi:hypothetical protein
MYLILFLPDLWELRDVRQALVASVKILALLQWRGKYNYRYQQALMRIRFQHFDAGFPSSGTAIFIPSRKNHYFYTKKMLICHSMLCNSRLSMSFTASNIFHGFKLSAVSLSLAISSCAVCFSHM